MPRPMGPERSTNVVPVGPSLQRTGVSGITASAASTGERPQPFSNFVTRQASSPPVPYGATQGCQWGHMAACPFFRSVMRHSFLSLSRIT